MSSDNIILDGEYEIDMSSLFSKSNDFFGIKFGFKPDNIDQDYPSLLVKDSKDDTYILKTESKELPKALNTTSSNFTDTSSKEKGGNNKLNQIFFEGSHAGSTSSSIGGNNSEYILVYDNIKRNFKMEKFQGFIKLNKSREPEVLNHKVSQLQKQYNGLSKEEYDSLSGNDSPPFVQSVIDSMNINTNTNNNAFIASSNSAANLSTTTTKSSNTRTNSLSTVAANLDYDSQPLSYSKSISEISPMKLQKKKLASQSNNVSPNPVSAVHSNNVTPSNTPSLIPISSPSIVTAAANSSSNFATGIGILAGSKFKKQPPKKSKLLRAAERAVGRSSKPRRPQQQQQQYFQSPNLAVAATPPALLKQFSGSRTVRTTDNISSSSTPLANDSDIEDLKLGSPIHTTFSNTNNSTQLKTTNRRNQTSKKVEGSVLSDEDLDDLVDELEEELQSTTEEEEGDQQQQRPEHLKKQAPSTETDLKLQPKSIAELMDRDSDFEKVTKQPTDSNKNKKIQHQNDYSTSKNIDTDDMEVDDWSVDISDWDDVDLMDVDDSPGSSNNNQIQGQSENTTGGFQLIIEDKPVFKSQKDKYNKDYENNDQVEVEEKKNNDSPSPISLKDSSGIKARASGSKPKLDGSTKNGKGLTAINTTINGVSPNTPLIRSAKIDTPKLSNFKFGDRVKVSGSASGTKNGNNSGASTKKSRATSKKRPPVGVSVAGKKPVSHGNEGAGAGDAGDDLDLDEEFDEEFDKALEDLDDEEESEEE